MQMENSLILIPMRKLMGHMILDMLQDTSIGVRKPKQQQRDYPNGNSTTG